ncbi:hypothetical protein TMatcc_001981 [Talaromyces marneffei ATCC 18224]
MAISKQIEINRLFLAKQHVALLAAGTVVIKIRKLGSVPMHAHFLTRRRLRRSHGNGKSVSGVGNCWLAISKGHDDLLENARRKGLAILRPIKEMIRPTVAAEKQTHYKD